MSSRKAFLKKYALRFAVTLAMLGLIVYTVAHALGFASGSVLTTPVRRITDKQITAAEAYLFRNEAVLTTEGAGLVDAQVENGTKVGKNVTVAKVWSTDESGDALVAAQLRLNRLNRSIAILQKSQLKPGTPLSEAEKYRAEYTALYREISSAVERGNLDRVSTLEEKLLIALNRYVSLVGKTDETEAYLQSLIEEKQALLGTATATEIKSEVSSGLFYDYGYVDGYETVFTPNELNDLTVSSLRELCEREPSESAGQVVGKLVYGYEWHLALELPLDVAASFRTGRSYQFCFPQNNDRAVSLTLTQIRAESGMALAVFACESHPNDFIFYRRQTVEITVGENEGFYIPETALVTQNGTVGVYVFEESTVRFRRIDLLYRGEGYAIATLPGADSQTELKENDILIVSGKDLYEGKVYR